MSSMSSLKTTFYKREHIEKVVYGDDIDDIQDLEHSRFGGLIQPFIINNA